ncbi:flagellar basal body rod protein FlgC [Terriglobus sp.]|uniref:flagellar basal body rod protein FlgC n=1 Tax=Terriglobus sp. TaxID=1889013 RepID=UPI003AFF8275
MNLFGVMHVSGAGLQVQRIRAEVVATNMANAETTRTEDGTPYQRRNVILQAGAGSDFVHITGSMGSTGPGHDGSNAVEVAAVMPSSAPPLLRYDPTHPDADSSGFVAYPDINPLTEMVDLMGASRAYSLNAGALQAEKGMLTASLDLLK